MALKDWRKQLPQRNPDHTIYEHRWQSKKLFISKTLGRGYSVSEHRNISDKVWRKVFKTKSQAIKFAKAYMRKN